MVAEPPEPPRLGPISRRSPFSAFSPDGCHGGEEYRGAYIRPTAEPAEHLYEGRDVAVTTDFRHVLAEVARRHLGLADPLFPVRSIEDTSWIAGLAERGVALSAAWR